MGYVVMEDLTRGETHFAFGKNWASFAERVGEAEISEAERGLTRLLGPSLNGLTFLDIGCGSGIHALAALRMGASRVVAVDIDADSVATAQALLERYAPSAQWRVIHQSVFEIAKALSDSGDDMVFDVVYSWGVLHHTGDQQRALRCAAGCVKPGGRFAFALYRRTWMDAFWKAEKRWYAHASDTSQARAQRIYRLFYRLGLGVTGRSFTEYVSSYRSKRGMSFDHDVHDWLGGWPYESISRKEVSSLMSGQGFRLAAVHPEQGPRLFGRDLGVLGSWCDEFVYRLG